MNQKANIGAVFDGVTNLMYNVTSQTLKDCKSKYMSMALVKLSVSACLWN